MKQFRAYVIGWLLGAFVATAFAQLHHEKEEQKAARASYELQLVAWNSGSDTGYCRAFQLKDNRPCPSWQDYVDSHDLEVKR